MWWPAAWREGHAAAASPRAGTRWAIADGQVVPHSDWSSFNTETYALIVNTSQTPADLTITFVFEDGKSTTRSFTVRATSRRNISFRNDLPETGGKRFAVLIESVGATPAEIVVDRSQYSDRAVLGSVGGRRFVIVTPWAAGASARATRLQWHSRSARPLHHRGWDDHEVRHWRRRYALGGVVGRNCTVRGPGVSSTERPPRCLRYARPVRTMRGLVVSPRRLWEML
jgi:hypothetical protein